VRYRPGATGVVRSAFDKEFRMNYSYLPCVGFLAIAGKNLSVKTLPPHPKFPVSAPRY